MRRLPEGRCSNLLAPFLNGVALPERLGRGCVGAVMAAAAFLAEQGSGDQQLSQDEHLPEILKGAKPALLQGRELQLLARWKPIQLSCQGLVIQLAAFRPGEIGRAHV